MPGAYGANRYGGVVNDSAHKVAAFIVHDVWLYAKARDDLRRVEMGDKAEGRPLSAPALAGIRAVA